MLAMFILLGQKLVQGKKYGWFLTTDQDEFIIKSSQIEITQTLQLCKLQLYKLYNYVNFMFYH